MIGVVHAREIIKLISVKTYLVEDLKIEVAKKFGKDTKYEDMMGDIHNFEDILKIMQERSKISIKNNIIKFLGCKGRCSTNSN